jgi:hypothetical protein
MSRAPEHLTPSWLPRRERRRINRTLHKLLQHDVCSVCGRALPHNSRTAYGLDSNGNVAVAGQCCLDRVALAFGQGFYSKRHYDFLTARNATSHAPEPTNEQIAGAIALYQKAVADTDKRLADVERHGGIDLPIKPELAERPWKDDDRIWFERNPKRAHRARLPFPGEADQEVAEVPAGWALVLLLRQVEPGTRLKAGFYLLADALPVPDDEALIHAMFEIAVGHEPMPRNPQAFSDLREKYTARDAGGVRKKGAGGHPGPRV